MKKLLALILALIMAFSLCACAKTSEPAAEAPAAPAEEAPADAAPAYEPMAFKYSCSEGVNSAVVKYVTEALESVTEYTGGAYTFEIFPDNQLGSITDVQESVFAGAPIIESVGFDQLGDIVADFAPASFPYLFQDIYEVYDLAESEWMTNMQDSFSAAGIHTIALGANGYRHFISTKPIESAESVKGMIIRMGPSSAAQGFIKVMGGTPTTSTWGDNYSLLQTGTFDACEANLEALWNGSFYEVCDYLSLTGHFVTPCALIVNDEIWSTIPADVQDVMAKALAEGLRKATDAAMESENSYIDQFKEAGVEVIEPDKATFAAFVPSLFEDLGIDTAIYDDIRAAIEG